jgi:hypothetical protein
MRGEIDYSGICGRCKQDMPMVSIKEKIAEIVRSYDNEFYDTDEDKTVEAILKLISEELPKEWGYFINEAPDEQQVREGFNMCLSDIKTKLGVNNGKS